MCTCAALRVCERLGAISLSVHDILAASEPLGGVDGWGNVAAAFLLREGPKVALEVARRDRNKSGGMAGCVPRMALA